MPGMNGIEATREILSISASTKVLALSIHADKQFVREMLDAGAVGYLLKEDAPEQILRAVEKIIKGDMFLSSGITRAALGADEAVEKTEKHKILSVIEPKPEPIEVLKYSEEGLKSISIREREILKLIAEGLRNKEIADKIYVSPGTVKKHIYNLFRKLKVSSRINAIDKAKESNLL